MLVLLLGSALIRLPTCPQPSSFPGLVMPKFARSKAEMVVAGVIPIDRLTDIRAPVDSLAARVGRKQVGRL